MAKTLDARAAEFRDRPLDGSPYTFVWVDALIQKVREGGRDAGRLYWLIRRDDLASGRFEKTTLTWQCE